jgi:hypothetical protein
MADAQQEYADAIANFRLAEMRLIEARKHADLPRCKVCGGLPALHMELQQGFCSVRCMLTVGRGKYATMSE